MQEALLPGTDAIVRGSCDLERYRGRWMARWKSWTGVPGHREFKDPDEAHLAWLAKLEDLKKERQSLNR